MRDTLPRWTDGVVLLDKPLGISSQKAVTIVKHACHADKAGHTGTLDPLATGLLAVCLGEATKYSQDLFNADKTYLTTIQFGVKTDSGDAEGKIIATQAYTGDQETSAFSATLEALKPQFLGAIQQVPPMYSALKKDGRPLYAYAREGEVFELEAREVHIRSLRWLSVAYPYAQLEVSCSKGTYIRSLVSDMGDVLGCGAHLTALRRTQIGHLNIAHAQLEAEIKQSPKFMAVDSLICHLPAIIIDQELALRFKMGQRVAVKEVNLPDDLDQRNLFKIYHLKNSPDKFMGLVELKNEVLHPKRLMATDRLENLLGSLPDVSLTPATNFFKNDTSVNDTSVEQQINKPIH